MQKKKSFLYGAFVLSASNLLIKIIGAVFRIPLTNLVGVAAMGYFSSAYSIYNVLLSLATAGLPTGIAVMVSRSIATEKYKDVKRILRISAAAFVSFGAVLSVLGMVFARQIAVFMNSEDAYYAMFWLMPAVFFISVVSLFKGFFQGFGNMNTTAMSNLIEATMKLTAGYSIAYLLSKQGYEPPIVVGGAIAGIMISTFCAMTYSSLRYVFRGKDYRFTKEQLAKSGETPTGPLAKAFFSIALPVMLSSISANLMSAIDSFSVVNCLKMYMSDMEEINFLWGSYSNLALTIFNLPLIFITSIGVALIPEISALFVKNNKKALKNSLERSLKTSALVAFACAAGILATSTELLSLLYSNKEAIAIASVILKILSFVIVCVGYTTVLNSILNAIKKATSSVVAIFIGSAIKSIFTVIFVSIPQFGIYGAPLATCVAYPVMLAIGFFFVKKHTQVKLSIKEIFLKPLLAGGCCYAASKLINIALYHFFPRRITVIFTVLLTVVAFLGIIVALKIISIDEIKSILKKSGKKAEKETSDELPVSDDIAGKA